MNSNDIKQVLAMKYIIRRFVALFILAGVIAVPAILGAWSFERDKNDNHNEVGVESNALSYAQIEPHIRTYMDEEFSEPNPTQTDPNAQAKSDQTQSTNTNIAVGTVLMYAGDKIPEGFLRCDGKEISRKKYKALYAAIGDKYGAGDGEKTFNLPNMRTLIPINEDGDVKVGKGSAKETETDATYAFKKISDPTGSPPDVDLDKERKKATGEGGANADDMPAAEDDDAGDGGEILANTAVMYFMIRY
jgi:microcystin-dependent protein